MEYPNFLYELIIKNNYLKQSNIDNYNIEPRLVYIYSDYNPRLFLKSIDSSNYILMKNPNTDIHKFISTKEIIEVNQISALTPSGTRQYIYTLSSDETSSLSYLHII